MLMELMINREVVIDGFQIFLCLLIIFLLIRNHRRRLKSDSADPRQVFGQDFNLQVYSQTIIQQIELAFDNIQNTVDGERRNIQKVMQIPQVRYYDQRPSDIPPSSTLTHSDDSLINANESVDRDSLQKRIRKMTGRGMSPKQIADELKTPLGEVELILNMQKNAS